MATRLATSTRVRFPHIEYGSGPIVYVAELSNEVVKVGYSSNVRTRLQCLAHEVRRAYGAEIVRFHVGHRHKTDLGARRSELNLLAQITAFADPIPGTLEFFKGLDFDAAVAMLANVSSGVGDVPRLRHPFRKNVYVVRKDGLFRVPVQVIDFYAD